MASPAELLQDGESGPALIPGQPGASLLVEKMGGANPAIPPVGDPLTTEEFEPIRAWIAASALGSSDDPASERQAGRWSLHPVQDSSLPQADSLWVRTPVDGFLQAAMRLKGLAPSEEADRRTLIRPRPRSRCGRETG